MATTKLKSLLTEGLKDDGDELAYVLGSLAPADRALALIKYVIPAIPAESVKKLILILQKNYEPVRKNYAKISI